MTAPIDGLPYVLEKRPGCELIRVKLDGNLFDEATAEQASRALSGVPGLDHATYTAAHLPGFVYLELGGPKELLVTVVTAWGIASWFPDLVDSLPGGAQ